MLRRATSWLAMVVACGALGGCKSGEDGENEADPISRSELPNAMVSVLCESLADCCSAAKYAFDSTNCPAAVRATVENYLDARATAAGRYDAQAAGDCLAELEQAAECGRMEDAGRSEACRRMLPGTLAKGEPCSNTMDCAGLGLCRQASTGPETTCVDSDFDTAPVHGREGDTCDRFCPDEESCKSPPSGTAEVGCYLEDSLYCSSTCQRFTDVGEPCVVGTNCKVGSFCDVDSKVCTAGYPNGAACKDAYDCQSEFCAFAADGSSGTCIAHAVTEHECAIGTP